MPSLARSLWLLCVLGFALEVGLRLLPYEWFSYRAWEALQLRRPPGGPFEAGRSLRMEDALGDLGHRLPFPRYRQSRIEEFIIDDCGFRNPPELLQDGIDIVLLGDSFAAGAGTTEASSPRAQLAGELNAEVYSLAGYLVTPADVRLLAERSNGKPNAAVFYFMERSVDMLDVAEKDSTPFCDDSSADTPDLLQQALRLATEPSRFKLLLQDILRPLYNDVLFPSQLGERVAEMELRDGSTRLYWRFDAAVLEGRDDEQRLVTLWNAFNQALKTQGIEFFVVLIPSSYNAYEALAMNPAVRRQTPSFLQRLQQRSAGAGIPTLNLEEVVRAEVRRRFGTAKPELYWIDDTHWSPEGIAFASRHIAAFLSAHGIGSSASES